MARYHPHKEFNFVAPRGEVVRVPCNKVTAIHRVVAS